MGFDTSAVRFLLHLKNKGVIFEKTVTLGRQSFQLSKNDLLREITTMRKGDNTDVSSLHKDSYYVEPFLNFLGASTIDSIDASSYEAATIIHDFNQPLPEGLFGGYDVVIDAGTLEHVFNFPQAIRNVMQLLKPGGSFISITTANNFFGHGFYQFSPELFYRVFSEENGFVTDCMYFSTTGKEAKWYEVPDPKDVKGRIVLENSFQSYLLVHARKKADVEVFARFPQQSDYELIAWTEKETNMAADSVSKFSFSNYFRLSFLIKKIKMSALAKRIKTIYRPFGSGSKMYFREVKNR